MRAVVQRTTGASVTVEGSNVGEIGRGLVVFLGIEEGDTTQDLLYICDKVTGLRVFDDENEIPNRSVQDIGGSVLLISQFTLYADTRKGRRPSWNAAAPGPVSEPLVDAYVAALRARGARVETGRFGADMEVSLVNDGPVTLVLDLDA